MGPFGAGAPVFRPVCAQRDGCFREGVVLCGGEVGHGPGLTSADPRCCLVHCLQTAVIGGAVCFIVFVFILHIFGKVRRWECGERFWLGEGPSGAGLELGAERTTTIPPPLHPFAAPRLMEAGGWKRR